MQTQAADVAKRLEVEKISEGPITCLRFRGTINEQFEGKKLGGSLRAKMLILDLSEVHKVSSFGIREWSAFTGVAEKSIERIYLIGCTPKVMNQLGMVSGLIGKGLIFSFYAPYHCDHCANDRLVLLNVDRDREAIKKLRPPERACETCGNLEYFDEDPVSFFSFVASQREFELDPSVSSFLVSKLNYPVSDLARRVHIEKIVDRRNTFIRLLGNLDASFPREKLAEGLEGVVVLDVSGVGGFDPAGAVEFRQFLGAISSVVERVFLVGCQPAFLERALRAEDLHDRAQVLSFTVPYSCGKCGTTAAQNIDVETYHSVLKLAMPPQLKCADCGGPTTCAASGALMATVRALPKPTVESDLKKFIKKAQKMRPRAQAQEGQPQAWGRVTAIGAAAVLAAAGAVVGIGYYQQQRGQELVEKAVASLQSAASVRRPQWITSDTPFSGYCTDLISRTVCVGVSSYRETKEAARAEAGDAALEALANTIGLKIDSPSFGQLVRNGYGEARRNALTALEGLAGQPEAAIDLARGRVRRARQDVARALERTGGAAVPTQIADWYWEQYEAEGGGSEYLAFVRYDVSTDAMKALVTRYSEPATALGAEVLTAFPSLAWQTEGEPDGAMIVTAENGVLAKLGLGARDVITAVRGQPVRDGAELAALIEAEHKALAEHGNKISLNVRTAAGKPLTYEGPIERDAIRALAQKESE
jgi:anti-anti-sigma regulatory factor